MWQGRDDGKAKIHNRVFKCLNKNSKVKLLSFCTSLGVQRNKGRVGSELAPNIIKENMANFAVFDDFSFDDVANIDNFSSLEQGDEILYKKCLALLKDDNYCVILGGGHESSLAPIKAALDYKKSIGVINLDAHFDVRKQKLHSSGNSFYKAYEYAKSKNYEYNYLCIGVNKLSNTQALFNTIKQMKAEYILNTNMHELDTKLKAFLDKNDFIYLSIDIDVFSLSIAPAVSAPNVFGINLEQALKALDMIFKSKKLIMSDVCEFNPKYDIDKHTAKLAAFLAYLLLRKEII